MKRVSHIMIFLLSILMLFAGCKSKQDNSQSLQALNAHKVEVLEFIQTTSYTYFRVNEGKSEYWMAAPKTETKVGETLYYNTAFPMADFESPELGRTFDEVLFIQDLTKEASANVGTPSNSQGGVHMGTPRNQGAQVVNTDGPGEITGEIEEEISLHELLTSPKKYANKLVRVSGKVTKVNPAIMDRNWVHITSEPSDGHNHDLTITTKEIIAVDDVISVQGQISIDRDFGAGYLYDVILENAKLITK